MPIPQGTYPIGGPLLDTLFSDIGRQRLTLRDAGVVYVSAWQSSSREVNAAGDGWEPKYPVG